MIVSILRPETVFQAQGDETVVLSTSGLTKRYGDRVAVEHFNLIVRRGEIYGLLGPNGAGKTTILRMLLGLTRPTAGTANILGYEPGNPNGLARIGAFVESPAFYPYLSGWDNLWVMGRHSGARTERIDEVLEMVELSAYAKDTFKTYSLGMRQQLGIAAALLNDPELLILDEPTNGLDPKGMTAIWSLIRRLSRGKRTVILSSYLLAEVEQVCDRIGVIQHGRLVSEGTIDELRGNSGLFLRADPLEQAEHLIRQLYGPECAQLLEGTLRLQLDPSQAATVARQLVAAGININELRPTQPVFEAAFPLLTSSAAGER